MSCRIQYALSRPVIVFVCLITVLSFVFLCSICVAEIIPLLRLRPFLILWLSSQMNYRP